MRRLGGAALARLHRLAYPATALAAIHFVWLVKAWPLEPLVYAAGVAALLGYRALRGREPAAGAAAAAERGADACEKICHKAAFSACATLRAARR